MTGSYSLSNLRTPIFLALWGLIFAKCYILEYWVRVYSVPINSALYVWSLTLFMAAAASYVLIHLTKVESTEQPILSEVSKAAKTVATAAGTAVFLILGLGWTVSPLAGSALQPYFSIILGASYIAIGFSDRSNLFLAGGLCWLLAAALLFLVTHALTLLIFGCMLLLLVVMPACLYIAQKWQSHRKIVQHS